MIPLLSNRAKAEIVGLLLLIALSVLLYKSRMTLSASRQQLADQVTANSAIIAAQSKRVEDRGKVTITKKFTPGNSKPSEVSTVIEPSRIETQRTSDITRGQQPPPARRRIIGLSLPFAPLPYRSLAIRAGYGVTDSLDFSISYSLYGPASERFRAEAAYRF